MTIGVTAPNPILAFTFNNGQLAAGGSVLTQVGGLNAATYQDQPLTVPLPNPIPLNSRGEVSNAAGASCQLFLTPNTVYVFTLFDAGGNQVWQATYVNGIQLTAAQAAALTSAITNAPVLNSDAQTAAEIALSIVPTNFSYAPYTMLRYGLDPSGVADSTTAINNCFALAKQAGYSKISIGTAGAKIKVNGVINWPVDTVGCDWQGAQLDCRGMSAASGTYVLNPTATYTDSNSLPGLIQSHPMENFTAIGPCTSANLATYAGTGFINMTQVTSFPCGITLRNGGSWNFYYHVNCGTGSFFESFENWAFDDVTYASVVGKSNLYINKPVATTAGERGVYFKCRLGAAPHLNQANNNADTHFIACSFDPIGTAGLGGVAGNVPVFTITNGAVFWSHCHLEGSGDGPGGGAGTAAQYYWVYISGQNTNFGWDSLTIVVDGAKTNYPLFYCDATVISGGIAIGTTFFVDGSTYSLPLIAGGGNVKQYGPIFIFGGGTLPYYTSSFLNILANGALTGASFTNDGWTTSGGAPPTIINTPLPTVPGLPLPPFTIANVMKFTVATGQTNVAKLVRPCAPGQIVNGQMWIRTDAFTGSNALFNVTVSYLDTAGNVLATFDTTFPGGISTTLVYTLYQLNPGGGGYVRAPPGTTQVQFQMVCNGSGTVTGSPIAYAGGFVMNLQ